MKLANTLTPALIDPDNTPIYDEELQVCTIQADLGFVTRPQKAIHARGQHSPDIEGVNHRRMAEASCIQMLQVQVYQG